MKPEDLTPSAIIAKWKKDKNYKNSMQFTANLPKFVRFREGIQWSNKAISKWKNFPFITVNQCDFIVENKKSNILSQSITMVFNPAEVPENMSDEEEKEIMDKSADYTDLTKNVWNMVDQDQLNSDAVDDCLVLGTAFYHYYFDSETINGQYSNSKGKIGGEIIDPIDVALGNPQLKPWEGNKQPYYIIKTYEDTEGLKTTAKKNGENWQLITSDVDNDQEYESAKEDTETNNKTVAYTMYYKINKEVYWVKVTGSATIQTNRKLAPERNMDSSGERDGTGLAKFTHYPIEPLVFRPRKKSTFGRSVIEDIIPTQKGINFLYSMIAYGVQGTAWPKILAKAGALVGNSITNEPGEVITDHDVGNQGDSIKFMQPPNFSNMPPLLIDKLTDAMRQTTGANEVNSGEAIGANMAAAAINLLQAQARKPNEAYMKQLYATNKRIGYIFEDFYKCYFILPRTITKKDANGKLESKTITPSEYKDYNFELSIDVGAGGEFSEAGQFSFVQSLYEKGDINKYQLVRYAPGEMVPVEMKKDFEEEEQKILEQEEMQAEQTGQVDDIIAQLTPEEQQAVQANPALLEGLGV